MGRKPESFDAVQRRRRVRRGVWEAKYKANPHGKSTIKLSNLSNRVLAAIEKDGGIEDANVQDKIRNHLDQLYPPANC